MKKPLDRFSTQSSSYKKYRPVYPQNLYEEILQHVERRDRCWDCGTGNGQVASVLSNYFARVEATDISENQLANATKKENINYSLQRAESTTFPDDHFDLITVGQAVHWFDFDRFNKEVNRVGRAGAIVAWWGYGLLKINPELDELIDDFDRNIVGPYWDVERRHIDEEYQNVPFDFQDVSHNNNFDIQAKWSLDHLKGYFESWSCVQNYRREHDGTDPVPALMARIAPLWPKNEPMKIRFPIFCRVGRVSLKRSKPVST